MLVANATGCSSIYGGNLPTTPLGHEAKARTGWGNSLFEDNAEFGLGIRLGLEASAGKGPCATRLARWRGRRRAGNLDPRCRSGRGACRVRSAATCPGSKEVLRGCLLPRSRHHEDHSSCDEPLVSAEEMASPQTGGFVGSRQPRSTSSSRRHVAAEGTRQAPRS